MISDAKHLFINGDDALKLEGYLGQCLEQLDQVDLKARKSLLLRHYQGLQTAMIWDISLVVQAIQSTGYSLVPADQACRVLGALVSLKSELDIKDIDWLYNLQDKAFSASMKNADLTKITANKERLKTSNKESSLKKIPIYSTRCV